MTAPEETLGLQVAAYWRGLRHTVYCEVAGVPGREPHRADLVAVSHGLGHDLNVIECKARIGVDVVRQALAWEGYAHFLWVATEPCSAENADTWTALLAGVGLGWIVATPDGPEFYLHAERATKPRRVSLLRDALRPEQEGSAPGNARGEYDTARARELRRLREIVANGRGGPLPGGVLGARGGGLRVYGPGVYGLPEAAGGRCRVIVHWLTLREAHRFVNLHHRHHEASRGGIFALGAFVAGVLVGVIVVGRPLAAATQAKGLIAEVLRCATREEDHATPRGHAKCIPSRLYAQARRVWQTMGGFRIETKILREEPGTSLLAAGWLDEGPTGGGSWDRKKRPRQNRNLFGERYPEGPKRRFAAPCGVGMRRAGGAR